MNVGIQEVENSTPAAGDPRRALVERVIASELLSKSKKLSSLLRFVCDLTLRGKEAELNEQKIGEFVFGRSASYDASNDGIVRVQASRLRQKLERYFEEVGCDEPVTITIPRGSYVPLFETRTSPKPATSDTATRESAPDNSTEPEIPSTTVSPEIGFGPQMLSKQTLGWAVAGLFLLLATGLAIRLLVIGPNRNTVSPSVNPLWKSLFQSGQNTIVVPGDNGLVLWESQKQRRVTLSEFIRGDYRKSMPGDSASDKLISDVSEHRYTTIVDLEITQALAHAADSINGNLETRYARDVRPRDLHENNAILIGATEANPWVQLFDPELNFRFVSPPGQYRFHIENRNPKSGEPKTWGYDGNHVYGIVAFVPSLNGDHNALLLGGTGMPGTQCAWNFVSDTSRISAFLREIGYQGGNLPHFEAVLESSDVEGSATRSRVVAWRVLQ